MSWLHEALPENACHGILIYFDGTGWFVSHVVVGRDDEAGYPKPNGPRLKLEEALLLARTEAQLMQDLEGN